MLQQRDRVFGYHGLDQEKKLLEPIRMRARGDKKLGGRNNRRGNTAGNTGG